MCSFVPPFLRELSLPLSSSFSPPPVNDDPSFRYKMPRLVAKIEGRGNGIKTVRGVQRERARLLLPRALPPRTAALPRGAPCPCRHAGCSRAATPAPLTQRAGAQMPPRRLLLPQPAPRRAPPQVVINMAEISNALNRPASLPTKFFGTELGAQTRWEADVNKCTVNGAHPQSDLQKLLNVFIDKFVLCPGCKLPETALVVRKGIVAHKCSACGSRAGVDMSHKLCVFILKEAATAAAALKEEAAKEKAEKKEKVRPADDVFLHF